MQQLWGCYIDVKNMHDCYINLTTCVFLSQVRVIGPGIKSVTFHALYGIGTNIYSSRREIYEVYNLRFYTACLVVNPTV